LSSDWKIPLPIAGILQLLNCSSSMPLGVLGISIFERDP